MAHTSDARGARSDDLEHLRLELHRSFARARIALNLTETRLLAAALFRESLRLERDVPAEREEVGER